MSWGQQGSALSHCPRCPLAAGPRASARWHPQTQDGLRGEPGLWHSAFSPAAPHAAPCPACHLRPPAGRELPVRDGTCASAVTAPDLALPGLLSVRQEGRARGDGTAGPPDDHADEASARLQPVVREAQNSSKIAAPPPKLSVKTGAEVSPQRPREGGLAAGRGPQRGGGGRAADSAASPGTPMPLVPLT